MHPHDFWQELHPPASFATDGPHRDFFPVSLSDGRQLQLPIRPLADGQHALASLIINQASFEVLDVLATHAASALAPHKPEVIVGLPTLGLTLAADVARKLGHQRYVPLGTSRKFWYEDELSVPLSSITTPEQQKRLYIDPRMLPLISGKRVALIDDVISSGTSILAGLSLLQSSGIRPVAIGCAMLQSRRWEEKLAAAGFTAPDQIVAAFSTPLLTRVEGGYTG